LLGGVVSKESKCAHFDSLARIPKPLESKNHREKIKIKIKTIYIW
jgi:hypothetical protein